MFDALGVDLGGGIVNAEGAQKAHDDGVALAGLGGQGRTGVGQENRPVRE
jgi:hypothetical protein